MRVLTLDQTMKHLVEADESIRREVNNLCLGGHINNVASQSLLTAQLDCTRAIDSWQDYLNEKE